MKIPYTKEHGAWVMFAIAFVTGTAKAERVDEVNLVLFLSMALFLMAKAPVSGFLRTSDKSGLPFIALYGALGAAGCLYSILRQPDLLVLYLAGLVLIFLYFIFARKGFPVLSEASAMAIMGLVAGISSSIGGDILSKLSLWLMFFLFYLASSFRVRLMMKKYRTIAVVYSSLMLLLSGVMTALGRSVFIAFLPLLEDLFAAQRGRKEEFKRIGIIETVKSIVFALLIIVIKD